MPAAGEAAALDRLNDFLEETIYGYGTGRNLLDRKATSFLSPYLRFGALSIRQAYWGAKAAIDLASSKEANTGAEAWLNELIWREFYMALLYHFPHTIAQPLREQFAEFEWLDDDEAFRAWCEGRTGYPVVDAAMRMLNATGWMHNRARMIVASFLTKDLLIDWRKGEQYFMQQLIDGDSASERRRLAVGGGRGRGCAALLPRVQSHLAGPALRSGRRVREAVAAGTGAGADRVGARAVEVEQRRSAEVRRHDRARLPGPDRRSQFRARSGAAALSTAEQCESGSKVTCEREE